MPGTRLYDPVDYRDELQDMVSTGMSAKAFIERSKPSKRWFTSEVLPICTISKCHACGRYFNPQQTGSLLECHAPRCGVALER